MTNYLRIISVGAIIVISIPNPVHSEERVARLRDWINIPDCSVGDYPNPCYSRILANFFSIGDRNNNGPIPEPYYTNFLNSNTFIVYTSAEVEQKLATLNNSWMAKTAELQQKNDQLTHMLRELATSQDALLIRIQDLENSSGDK